MTDNCLKHRRSNCAVCERAWQKREARERAKNFPVRVVEDVTAIPQGKMRTLAGRTGAASHGFRLYKNLTHAESEEA